MEEITYYENLNVLKNMSNKQIQSSLGNQRYLYWKKDIKVDNIC